MPIVFPAKSIPRIILRILKSPERTARSKHTNFFAQASSKRIVCSATAIALESGALVTQIFCSAAAFRSILSTPTPCLLITFTVGMFSSTLRVMDSFLTRIFLAQVLLSGNVFVVPTPMHKLIPILFFLVKVEPAKNCLVNPYIMLVNATGSHLLQSTVRPFRKICWKVSYLDILVAPLQVQAKRANLVYLNWHTMVQFFLTKFLRCH